MGLATASLSVVVPGAARADEVAVAQARVDALQGLVAASARTLTAGTRQWEADQASLRVVQLQVRNAQRHVQESERAAADTRAKVASMARRLYMSPMPSGLQLAFTRGPDQVIDALQSRGSLALVAGSDATILRRAQTARLHLQARQVTLQQLESDARRLVDGSKARLAELDALAQRTSDRLSAAQQALQGARERKAAGIARAAAQARAAAVARAARTARDAADRAAAQAALARAARVVPLVLGLSFASSVTACTGGSTAGQANGNLDPGSLCPLWSAPGERLRSDAAAAFNRLSHFHVATVGNALCVTDSYRSYSEQVSVYQRKPGLAAIPGTSEHGWGLAVDFCGGIQESGSAASAWMKANAGRFGFFHPSWAEPSGNRPEPWHWEFNS